MGKNVKLSDKKTVDDIKSENVSEKKRDTVDINTPLFKLAAPVFFQALLSMLIGYADSLMLTRYSETAVGAVGNANQVLGFLTLAFTIISSASGVVVSQYLGAKEHDKLGRIYTVALAFNFTLSITISAVIFFGSTTLLRFMQLPQEMMSDAVKYMRIVGGFIFLQALTDTFNQFLRSNGKMMFGMMLSFTVNVLNIIGNFLFLYGPLKSLGLGASGVAVSSVFSRLVGIIVIAVYFKLKIDGDISLRYLFPFPRDILKSLLTLGIPTAGENISYNISQIVITALVNTMGIAAINTKIYCSTLTSFSYLYSVSVAVATQIIVGHAVGAKNYDLAYKRVIRSLIPSLFISVGIALTNFLISPLTLSIFTDNAECIALGREVMVIAIFLEIGRTCNLVIINSMRAAGDVKFPTMLGICSMWGVSVLFTFILGIVLGLGLHGVWIAMAADEIIRGIIVTIRWKKGSWRGKRVVKDET